MHNEIAVCGALLEINGDCPPFLARLLDNSPESFDDARCGQVAAAIKNLRREGQPVHSVSVAESVTFPDSTTFIMQAVNESLPLSIAEPEAEKLWHSFQSRRTVQLFAEAADAVIHEPERSKDIREHVISELERLDAEQDSLHDRLNKRIYNASNPPPEPVTVFFVGNVPVSTQDNLTTISAPVKAGKTAVIDAMIASTFCTPDADCLGFRSRNPQGLAVVHIDSEQSPHDHHTLIERAVKRAECKAAPDRLRSYCLTGFSPPDIRKSIRLLIQQAAKRFKGVLAVLIDGIADAASDVNDPKEANAFVAELHALAIEFRCVIVAVIHLNPGSDFKTRGHLGSQLERKAETNLKIEKDDEICTLWAEKNRHAPILKKSGPRFAWVNEAGMHVSVESQQEAKADLEFDELSAVFKAAFGSHPAMSHSDLTDAVITALKTTDKKRVSVVPRTAERKIARGVTLGIIKKTFAGLYEIKV